MDNDQSKDADGTSPATKIAAAAVAGLTLGSLLFAYRTCDYVDRLWTAHDCVRAYRLHPLHVHQEDPPGGPDRMAQYE